MLDTRAIFPLTRRQAAWRGATAGMLWATAWLLAVTSVSVAYGGVASRVPGALEPAVEMFSLAPWRWKLPAISLVGAALAGALVGLAGRALRARPWVRAVVLWLAFFPAVALVSGPTVLGVGVLGDVASGRLPHVAEPMSLVGLCVVAVVLVAPSLVLPLLGAGLTVERLTRAPRAMGPLPRRHAPRTSARDDPQCARRRR